MNLLEQKIGKTTRDLILSVMEETEQCLEKFVDTYKPKELTNEEFLSLYNISYEIKQEGSYIRDGVIPRLFLNIKLKTPEELLKEIENE